MTIIDSAIEYAEKYGWAVFPVKGKIPATPRGFKDAKKTADEIRALFSKHHGDGIGLATGAVSGVFAFDEDVKPDKKGVPAGGDDSRRELELEHGKLPETVMSLTPSKGSHRLYKYPEGGIGSNAGVVAKGIDIRGDGGYIVLPPSPGYHWEDDPTETAIVDAPQWLIDMARKKKKAIDLSENDGTKITENRNVSLTKIAGNMRRNGLGGEALFNALMSVNLEKCYPPLDENEVRNITNSIGQKAVVLPTAAYTDLWAGKFFHLKHGKNLHWCDPLGGWFMWDETRWVMDETLRIMRLADSVIEDMHKMSSESEDKKLRAFAIAREALSKKNAMITTLSGLENIAVTSDHFDQDTHLINCLNGTIDLKKIELKEHFRGNLITRRIEVKYNPEARAPRWEQFMLEIFDGNEALVEYVQRAVGYSLCGETKEHCLFVLYGHGKNGKSTFIKRIAAILGDYSANAPSSLLVETRFESNGPTSDIARLRGTRFISVLESKRGNSFDEARVKALTGGDKITACFKYKEPFEFDPTFKIFFSTNHKPDILGTDSGIWRRIRTIPFRHYFDNPDFNLDAKLETEHEGIFNWMVEGYKKWAKNGLGDNKDVQEATDAYEQESDVIGTFIEERCNVPEVFDADKTVGVTDLVVAFRNWSKITKCRFFTRNEISEYLEKKKGLKKWRGNNDQNRGYFWTGIELKVLDGEMESFGRKGSFLRDFNNERPY